MNLTINDFKNDILSGKIKEIALLETPIKAIKNNVYSHMFNVWRKIVNANDEFFEVGTINKDGSITYCEAYYNIFDNYSGETVSSKYNKDFFIVR